jgi:hypothetical protein
MSEKAPQSNSRLDNFEANKAAYEAEHAKNAREAFENSVYGEAGVTDFSDEARKRVEEADVYERHMEHLANNPDTDFFDRVESGEIPSRALGVEQDEANAMHEELQAGKDAEVAARDAKIEADPQLRRMDNLAREIAKLRAETDPDDPDAAIDGVQSREDALNELLAKYENNELFTLDSNKNKKLVKYDPAIADELMNRTRDEDVERENSLAALGRAEDDSEIEKLRNTEPAVIDGDETEDDEISKLKETEPAHIDGDDEDIIKALENTAAATIDGDPDDEDDEIEKLRNTEPAEIDGDVEKPSWWKRMQDRAGLLVMQGLGRVQNRMEDLRTYNKEKGKGNNKELKVMAVIGGLAVLGTIVAAIVTKDTETANTIGGQGGSGGGGAGIDISPDVPTIPDSEFANVKLNVTQSGEWGSTMDALGVPEDLQRGRLEQIGKDLEALGWAKWDYPNTEWRIAHDGQLPQNVLELIKYGNGK